jgi:TolB protein
MPPGSWSSWGTGGTSSSPGSQPAAANVPPPRPELVATGAGRQLQRLTTDDTGDETDPTPSPDGKWLLFTSAIEHDGASASRIMRSRIDGRGGVMLTSESGYAASPSWLPSGTSYLAVSDAMGGHDIVRMVKVAPHAATSRILSSRDVVDPGGLAVSPDGTHVAFHCSVGGVWTLAVARTDGSELTTLVAGVFPAWSPDSKRLVFHREVGTQWQLFVTDAEGGELTQLTEGAVDNQPTWSPDGKVIAFLSNRGYNRYPGADGSEPSNVFAIRADGSGLVELTDGNRKVSTPAWGRDGKLYFASNDAGTMDLYRIDVDRSALASAE